MYIWMKSRCKNCEREERSMWKMRVDRWMKVDVSVYEVSNALCSGVKI